MSQSVSSTPILVSPPQTHSHLSDHFNACESSLMHKRSRGGLLSDIVKIVVLCHHGYAALTYAHQCNGLYVSLIPCIFSGTYQFGGGRQGQDKKTKQKREFAIYVLGEFMSLCFIFRINYSSLFIVVETLFTFKCCFKTGLMMVKWNNSFLTPNKSFFSSRAAF